MPNFVQFDFHANVDSRKGMEFSCVQVIVGRRMEDKGQEAEISSDIYGFNKWCFGWRILWFPVAEI
jgi:hypothetical protein